MKTVEIAPGVFMPMIGVGTWRIRDEATIRATLDAALECGYRSIDTAACYGNESLIGEALQSLLPKHGLRREDIFIASKLRTTDHGSGAAYQAGLRSVANLRTDYLDLFLIHFPGVSGLKSDDPRVAQLRKASWQDLEKLKNEGKFRCIGVSNYLVRHLDQLRQHATDWPPAVNQCEYHPHYKPDDLWDYCRRNGIHFQAYSSLGGVRDKGELEKEPVVRELSGKYGCSPQQLLLAWALNQGVSVLPKTTNPEHVRANLKSLELIIEKDDTERLSGLETCIKYCWDPAVVL